MQRDLNAHASESPSFRNEIACTYESVSRAALVVSVHQTKSRYGSDCPARVQLVDGEVLTHTTGLCCLLFDNV